MQNIEKARELFEEAGFAGGNKFPTVRLVINRNDVQNRIAKAVARMWKQNLNIETEIVVREAAEIDDIRSAGDFDVLRRGVVLPTTSRAGSLRSILAHEESHNANGAVTASTPADKAAPTENSNADKRILSQNVNGHVPDSGFILSPEELIIAEDADGSLTEEEAIAEMVAIPLYFPTSYSLVKPYIQGFEINTLDAPSLKHVRIDINWQPKKANGES